MRFLGEPDLLCLDWDERSLRVVNAGVARGEIFLRNAFIVPISPGVDVRDPASLGAFIRKSLSEHRIRTRRAIVDVPRHEAHLTLMNLRAYALRDKLELNELERLMTRAEVARCLGVATVGLLSVVVAMILPGGLAGLAGLAYFLIGLVELLVGWHFGNQRDVLVCQQGTDDACEPK